MAEKEKLSFQTLTSDTPNVSPELSAMLDAYEQIKLQIIDKVKADKPAPKGKKWVFSWRFGCGVALASGSGGTNYFA